MLGLLLLWLMGLGCSESISHVPGSTLRVGQATLAEGTELDLFLFTNKGECRGGEVDEALLDSCIPRVDRAQGQVRLGFQLRLDNEPFALPITSENIEVYHMGSRVLADQPPMRVEVVPHDPIRAAQLFILVIDGSGSMNQQDADGVTRMEKVREALLDPGVVDGFFPTGVKTGVILLTFTAGEPRPVGTKAIEIIKNPGRYKKLVREHLQPQGGYTHFYNAISYASVDLLKNQEIADFIALNEAQPTIVALTDGFNNEQSSDTCGSNAERLSRLLKRLKEARHGDDIDIRSRPTVFTVGLGRPLRRRSKVLSKLDPERTEVSAKDLCGGKLVDQRIDGGLEKYGIDNASLEWIALHGGGFSYVRQDSEGLGTAFKGAAAERFLWFELRYALDPFFLRRSFETTVRLVNYASAEAKLTLYPSAFFDAPTARAGPGGWAEPTPFLRSMAVIMPILGMLVTLTFTGAAIFNTRRALFGRTRKPKAAPAAAPPDSS
ncbi:MAG: VWA domain-containing protein [Alphaproteobacteria bacterium]|nr:VWA domain-containing protein [Alphaproteobacteria bacterium]